MTDGVLSARRPIEWPTVLLIAGLWVSFGLITWFHGQIPWWILAPVGAYLCALHGSLQHEALHGHPTRSTFFNELLLFPPITLWIPYRRYKKLHLIHHRNDFLTDPAEDPESYYFDPQAWERTPPSCSDRRSSWRDFGQMSSAACSGASATLSKHGRFTPSASQSFMSG
jgi:fatty acid desaturase